MGRKAIDKDYLLTQLKNFDKEVLSKEYGGAAEEEITPDQVDEWFALEPVGFEGDAVLLNTAGTPISGIPEEV